MPHSAPRRSTALTLSSTLAVAVFALTACAGGASDEGKRQESTSAASSAQQSEGGKGGEQKPESLVEEKDQVDPTKTTEVSEVTPRVLLSHDDGLTLIDPESGETVKEQDVKGFKRLSNAGNGKDVLVTTENGWEVFSTGVKAQVHGDHHHYYESEPGMTGVTFPGEEAGHAVVHHGKTTLFADATGKINTFVSDDLDKATADLAPVTEDMETENAHHGVALELNDGSVLTTEGTEDERHTVKVVDRESGDEKAKTEQCPGVHGEAAAAPHEGSDVVVLGCEDGPVVYRDGEFHKVDVEPEYQRSGNLAGSEDSPIVLGDYKVEEDPEGGIERPTEIALIDSVNDSLKTVDLGSSYWFRSLARGPEGEAVVLTYDGEVNVIDEESGEIVHEVPAIAEWKEKDEWQQPGPILKTAGDKAYVTDAENKKLVVVDLVKGEKVDEFDLDFAPVEMAVVDGHPEAPAEEAEGAGGHEGHDHGHEGHEHGGEAHSHEGHDHAEEGHSH